MGPYHALQYTRVRINSDHVRPSVGPSIIYALPMASFRFSSPACFSTFISLHLFIFSIFFPFLNYKL